MDAEWHCIENGTSPTLLQVGGTISYMSDKLHTRRNKIISFYIGSNARSRQAKNIVWWLYDYWMKTAKLFLLSCHKLLAKLLNHRFWQGHISTWWYKQHLWNEYDWVNLKCVFFQFKAKHGSRITDCLDLVITIHRTHSQYSKDCQ